MAGIYSTIRDELETLLTTISGLNVTDHAPDGITAPVSATIRPAGSRPRATFSGIHIYRFEIEVRVASALAESGWKALDSFTAPTGSSSIEAAIETDKTLGGNADWAVVVAEEIEHDREAAPAGGWHYVARIPVEVQA